MVSLEAPSLLPSPSTIPPCLEALQRTSRAPRAVAGEDHGGWEKQVGSSSMYRAEARQPSPGGAWPCRQTCRRPRSWTLTPRTPLPPGGRPGQRHGPTRRKAVWGVAAPVAWEPDPGAPLSQGGGHEARPATSPYAALSRPVRAAPQRHGTPSRGHCMGGARGIGQVDQHELAMVVHSAVRRSESRAENSPLSAKVCLLSIIQLAHRC